MTVNMTRRLVAEALGTAFLLATVVGSGIMAESLADGKHGTGPACECHCDRRNSRGAHSGFGPISGAHFNPAVTLCFLIRREIAARHAALYCLVQVAAGIAGVVVAHVMFAEPIAQASMTARTGVGQWTESLLRHSR